MSRRRIQSKSKVEVKSVGLRLPTQLVRAANEYAMYLGGGTDRTCGGTQAIEIASSRNAAVLTPALSGTHGGPSLFPRQ